MTMKCSKTQLFRAFLLKISSCIGELTMQQCFQKVARVLEHDHISLLTKKAFVACDLAKFGKLTHMQVLV